MSIQWTNVLNSEEWRALSLSYSIAIIVWDLTYVCLFLRYILNRILRFLKVRSYILLLFELHSITWNIAKCIMLMFLQSIASRINAWGFWPNLPSTTTLRMINSRNRFGQTSNCNGSKIKIMDCPRIALQQLHYWSRALCMISDKSVSSHLYNIHQFVM